MPMPPKPDPEKDCIVCGQRMVRKRYNGRLEDMGVFLRRERCSNRCRFESQRQEVVSAGQLYKRARALAPLAPACQDCGTTERLHRHHIDHNPANNVAENVMTLCAACHRTWHWRNGDHAKQRHTAAS
jgi:5-methylcytosine-specific restriction endonuclease McrA